MIKTEEYKKMKFSSFGFTEPALKDEMYRLPQGFKLNAQPTHEIRNMISNIMHEKKEETGKSISTLLTADCDIAPATYQKYMFSRTRAPSRLFIAKLCVGLQLSIEEANKLFIAQAGELNLTNDVDAITYYAIICKDSIYDYEAELKEKAGITISKY